jgi:hypothetical protein
MRDRMLLCAVCPSWFDACRWSYSPTEDTFIWEGGSPADSIDAAGSADYPAVLGEPTATALPLPRWVATGVTDVQGRLWLLGGYAQTVAGTYETMSDVWAYWPPLGQWSLMYGGISSATWGAAQYGQFRVPSSSNSFPARQAASADIDAGAGIIYVTAGIINDASLSFLADVFAYDISSGVWSWIGGSNEENPSAVYPAIAGTTAGELRVNRLGTDTGVALVDPSGGL